MPTVYIFFIFFNMLGSMLVLFHISHTESISFDNNKSIFVAFGVQLIHCIAILGLIYLLKYSLLPRMCINLFHFAANLFCVGLLVFSLNIYLKYIFGYSFFAPVIPFGGATLFVGWAAVLTGQSIWLFRKISGAKF